MRTRLFPTSLFVTALLLTHCTSAPAPEPVSVSEPEPVAPLIFEEEAPAPPEEPIGMVVVRASALNVREDPTTDAATLHTVRRGTRLTLFREEDGWSRVRLADGRTGWVSSKYVRSLKNCPADRDFRFIEAPPLAFSQDGPHGVVTIDVTVNLRGAVVRTKVTSNTTGDPALAEFAVKEIRTAKFANPIRNCRPIEFIYVHRRPF